MRNNFRAEWNARAQSLLQNQRCDAHTMFNRLPCQCKMLLKLYFIGSIRWGEFILFAQQYTNFNAFHFQLWCAPFVEWFVFFSLLLHLGMASCVLCAHFFSDSISLRPTNKFQFYCTVCSLILLVFINRSLHFLLFSFHGIYSRARASTYTLTPFLSLFVLLFACTLWLVA